MREAEPTHPDGFSAEGLPSWTSVRPLQRPLRTGFRAAAIRRLSLQGYLIFPPSKFVSWYGGKV